MIGITGYNKGMAKKRMNYPEQVNLLCAEGVRDLLVAIAFYRGEKGKYAIPARDFITDGIARFVGGLSVKERAVFDEILATVKTSELYRKEVRG